MEKCICIHGHFYQPPRENPWLESVELQDSASPYHDWNERITAECYAPNATARILDGEGRIQEITNNYSRISFNFGPTLLAWMKDKMPLVHGAIVAADELSKKHFSGHGSAMAQVYNHMILPLANTRDKQTQVHWGIRDFESRFGRKPEGMWLSETAADTDTLEALAAQDIKFTLLSPFQASRVRELGKRNWKDVNGAQIDPTRAYVVRLPSGRKINVFFYDGPVSQAVAFEKLLVSGERLAHRMLGALSDERKWDQVAHIATDGESYGHHHRHGEMALGYALNYIQKNNLARLTNYGEFLEKYPPTHEVQIHEKSAWSCSHGVGRWMADCGCNTGRPGWNQAWRAPLRNALDWLRDEINRLYEPKAAEYLKDAWKARDNYVEIILDRSPENREKYFAENQTRELKPEEKVTVLKLCEMQRHAMLMYTSCGWFFDELSGIETVQVIQYAARAIQLAREIFNQDLEGGFLERLQAAKSNILENGDGKTIYEKFVKPAMIDWTKATAHYAISSLFQQYGEKTRIFSFAVEDEHRETITSGKTRLVVGRSRLTSEITQESDVLSYAILYMGEHNVTGGVKKFENNEAFEAMQRDIKEAFNTSDFPQTIRSMDRHFGETFYSLKSLFKDEQRRILTEILSSTREDLDHRFRLIAERYTPLMKFLHSAGAPLPAALETSIDYVLQSDIRRTVDADPIDLPRLRELIQDAKGHNGRVLDAEISFVFKKKLEDLILALAQKPEEMKLIKAIDQLAEIVMPVPLGLNLWRVQNTYWEMLQGVAAQMRIRAESGEESAREWLATFNGLGARLGFEPNLLTAPAAPLSVAA